MSNSGVIYGFKSPLVDCPEEYIGELGRTLRDRLREHLRAPYPIHQHSQTNGHQVDLECFTVANREAQSVDRTIQEAMYIHVNGPSFNRNLGKTSYPTYGMKYYRTLLHFISSNPAPPSFHNGPNHCHCLTTHHIGETQIFTLVSMVPLLPFLPNEGVISLTLLP